MIRIAVILSFVAAVAADPARPVAHRIEVVLDPEAQVLTAVDHLEIAGQGELALRLHPDLEVTAVEGVPAGSWAVEGGATLRVTAVPRLTVRYRGRLHQDVAPAGFARDATAGISATIGPRGTYLAPWAGWYPAGDGLASFRLEVDSPVGHEVVAEGQRVERSEREGRSTACT